MNKFKHGSNCQCLPCITKRQRAYTQRVMDMAKPKPPPGEEYLVPVRAHWRKVRNYKAKDPEVRSFAEALVHGLLKGMAKGHG